MSYSVKLAESEDIDKLIQLRLDFSDANNGPHPETYELRKANLKSYFERHLNRDCYAAIVEQDGKAVSTGILGVYENPPSPSRPNGRFASIISVWTYPEYRRQGYAGLVMEMLKLKARENDAAYIELSATPMGRPLYEKLGFKARQSENVQMRYTFKQHKKAQCCAPYAGSAFILCFSCAVCVVYNRISLCENMEVLP